MSVASLPDNNADLRTRPLCNLALLYLQVQKYLLFNGQFELQHFLLSPFYSFGRSGLCRKC